MQNTRVDGKATLRTADMSESAYWELLKKTYCTKQGIIECVKWYIHAEMTPHFWGSFDRGKERLVGW